MSNKNTAQLAAKFAAEIAKLPPQKREEFLASRKPEEREVLEWVWELKARPDQLPPQGDWRTWLMLAGRGAGKTRTAAEWLRSEVENGRSRCAAIAAPTNLAARKVLIEGESGILAICPPWDKPTYEMAIGKLSWANGAVAHVITSETPDRVRGYNFDLAICDELAAWQDPAELWLQLQLALRIRGPQGNAPRVSIATTPKSIPVLKEIMADPGTITTRASTFDNEANLSPTALDALKKRYAGTSIGRQELYGEMLLDADDALWHRGWIDTARVSEVPELARVVIAVDPSVSAGANSGECGIVAIGKAASGDLYVLGDYSLKAMPEKWARQVMIAYETHEADAIVCEINQGGALVTSVLQSVGAELPIKTVHASRGKTARAEPVSALYQQGRVHHVGVLPTLEDQLCSWVAGESASPDRLDALVWGVTELALGTRKKEPEWAKQSRLWRPPSLMNLFAR